MSESVFREKSLEKVKSPDNLNEYIRVSNPSIWMLLASIIFLLLGFLIWGVFGQIHTVVRANAQSQDGSIVCYLSDKDAGSVKPGMTAQIGGQTGTVQEVVVRSGMDSTCEITLDEPLSDGIYDVTIEVESIRPVSFLLS